MGRRRRRGRWTRRALGLAAAAGLVAALLIGLRVDEAGQVGLAAADAAPRSTDAAPAAFLESAADIAVLDPELAAAAQFLRLEADALGALIGPAVSGARRGEARLRRGETIEGMLRRRGIDREEARAAAAALGQVFDSRTLHVGHPVTLHTRAAANGGVALTGFALDVGPSQRVRISRRWDGAFGARAYDAPLTRRTRHIEGAVSASLYGDAVAAGAPPAVVAEVASLLSHAVDFQREIRRGARFAFLFDELVDGDGRHVRVEKIRYFAFTPGDKTLAYWRYAPEGADRVGYFDANGANVKRFLMKTPINGARLSSRFGQRRHPVLGYTKMHKGVDFAAPTGTKVYAAGDGIVRRADRFGSFGNYVRIDHGDGFATAYAHLNGFAKGVRKGARVRQGDVIGYVGATGRSTGPHLHYEVMRNGMHLDPMRLKTAAGAVLSQDDRVAFDVERVFVEARRARLASAEKRAAEAQMRDAILTALEKD